MRNMTDEALLREYVQKGKTLSQCSEYFGKSLAGVWKRLQKIGVDTSSRLGSGRRGKSKMIVHHSAGYLLVYKPGHPAATKTYPYVLQHRIVMEKHLGRYLKRKEVVHHKNGVRSDNRLSNLELMTGQKEHASHHNSFVSREELSARGKEGARIRWLGKK